MNIGQRYPLVLLKVSYQLYWEKTSFFYKVKYWYWNPSDKKYTKKNEFFSTIPSTGTEITSRINKYTC